MPPPFISSSSSSSSSSTSASTSRNSKPPSSSPSLPSCLSLPLSSSPSSCASSCAAATSSSCRTTATKLVHSPATPYFNPTLTPSFFTNSLNALSPSLSLLLTPVADLCKYEVPSFSSPNNLRAASWCIVPSPPPPTICTGISSSNRSPSGVVPRSHTLVGAGVSEEVR